MLVALMPVGEALWVDIMEDLLVRSTPSAQVQVNVVDSTRRYKSPVEEVEGLTYFQGSSIHPSSRNHYSF